MGDQTVFCSPFVKHGCHMAHQLILPSRRPVGIPCPPFSSSNAVAQWYMHVNQSTHPSRSPALHAGIDNSPASCHRNKPPKSEKTKSSGPLGLGRIGSSSSSCWDGRRLFREIFLFSDLMGDRPGLLVFRGVDVDDAWWGSSSSRMCECRARRPPMSERKALDPDREPECAGWDKRRVASWRDAWRDREAGESVGGLSTRPPTSKKPIRLGVSGSA